MKGTFSIPSPSHGVGAGTQAALGEQLNLPGGSMFISYMHVGMAT